ncbi:MULTISPECIES: hypothetical protein [unclassified Pseudomonas]|uniref:hypothetical protein n=1 Tax=unclassified Pseudomonas TaxID=196821 RepID=UPI00215E7510|nr:MULTISPECIES: hypothetical protein [unclassified Pseudomonas]UVM51193.1 hypothetical protein LOY38_03725 [Pseudomonas sp. B21-015]WPN58749.1 hypothetical protein QMK51_03710 [Pseudomonas sp. P9_31]
MSMKTNGLALKSFYTDAQVWSNQEGKPLYWIDDISLAVNGSEIVEDSLIQTLHDNDEVQILNGVIYSYEDLGEVATLVEYFKSWQQNLGSRNTSPDS